MTARRYINVNIGKVRSVKPMYPSEPGYIAQMQAQSRAMTDALLEICNGFENVSNDVMMDALEPTFELAGKYTPKDTLRLFKSEYLEVNAFRGKPRVELGFARGGDPPYAMYVHEMVDIEHKAPTRSKFLQAAMMEDLGNIYKRLGEGYRAFMVGLQ